MGAWGCGTFENDGALDWVRAFLDGCWRCVRWSAFFKGQSGPDFEARSVKVGDPRICHDRRDGRAFCVSSTRGPTLPPRPALGTDG
jgi:hypothetical protein